MKRDDLLQRTDAALSADALNAGCHCVSVEDEALRRAVEDQLASPDILQLLRERCSNVFSARPVFVPAARMREMQRIVAAVESVVALPAYRELVLARSPAIARKAPPAAGVFFGYDFHASDERLGLIEINTNAGGAMLNAIVGRAHRACCEPVASLGPAAAAAHDFERAIVAMFREEWTRAATGRELRTIAIVDEDPPSQYLFAEFLLFQRLFEGAGLQAFVLDPSQLESRADGLYAQGTRIDLVYNRLTDFYFDAPSSQALRQAYEAGTTVVTPHPHAHALYADKRNLAVLSDAQVLHDLGVDTETIGILAAGVPRTVVVDAANSESLWSARKRLFFKPWTGYGSRAAYRGDKLTQRVWSEIAAGNYVAQDVVDPAERALEPDAKPLKFDLREYVYEGRVQWTAARLYQGQTTNFRTPGGGFAPVYALPL